MQMWKKVAIGAVSALTIAGGANLAAMAAGSDDSATVDVRGPCDEAEHANDPQCATPQVREDQAGERERGDDRGREHEAENEAREVENDTDDHSARGSENEGRSDRSGHDDGAGHDGGDDHGGND